MRLFIAIDLPDDVKENLAALQKEVDKIHLRELKEDISSSDIRRELKAGRSVARVVPPAVLAYIKEKGLYK